MRILFVLENYYPNIGGVETLFKSLAESLVEEGHQVTVLTNKFSSELKSEETIKGVYIKRLSLLNRYIFTLFGFFGAYGQAKKHDVIHTTSYNAAIPAFFAGMLSGKKVLITFHEVWGKLWFRLPYMNKISLGLHYLFEKTLLKFPFKKFIAVSNTTAHHLKLNGVNEEKITTIHNGIDYNLFPNRPLNKVEGEFQFIYFGRLGISKGLDLLLDAVTLLSKDRKDFKLKMIIPTTPVGFHKKVRKIIKRNNLESLIDIESNLPFYQLKTQVQKSHAVVIPSYSEGFCFTAVESMALGVPIITSAQGALQEVVTGKHLHMESLNAEALRDCMIKALNDEWKETPLRKYELSASVNAYMQLYKELLEA